MFHKYIERMKNYIEIKKMKYLQRRNLEPSWAASL